MSSSSSTFSASPAPTFIPALKPPAGVEPNPDAPNGFYPWLVLTETVCVTLTGIALIIRCVVRPWLMRQWGVEDALAVVSWLFYLSISILIAVGTRLGGGQYQWDLDKDQLSKVLYLFYVNEILYGFTVIGIKWTLCLIYQRLFAPSPYSKRWWTIVIVMLLNLLFYLGLTFSKIFICEPRNAAWDVRVLDKHCGSQFGVLVASGIWNTASDVVILLMPLLFIWQLALTTKQRLNLVAVFAIGAIAPLFSVLGMVMRVRLVVGNDSSYAEWRLLLFVHAELTAGYICTSLPLLPRFWLWVRDPKNNGPPSGNWVRRSPSARYANNSHDTANARRQSRRSGIQMLQDKKMRNSAYLELGERRNGSKDGDVERPAPETSQVAGSWEQNGIAVIKASNTIAADAHSKGDIKRVFSDDAAD